VSNPRSLTSITLNHAQGTCSVIKKIPNLIQRKVQLMKWQQFNTFQNFCKRIWFQSNLCK